MKIIKRKNEEEKCGSISLTYGSTTMWMGLDDVINGFIVHVSWANTADVLVAVSGNQAGAVEGIHRDNLEVFDLD